MNINTVEKLQTICYKEFLLTTPFPEDEETLSFSVRHNGEFTEDIRNLLSEIGNNIFRDRTHFNENNVNRINQWFEKSLIDNTYLTNIGILFTRLRNNPDFLAKFQHLDPKIYIGLRDDINQLTRILNTMRARFDITQSLVDTDIEKYLFLENSIPAGNFKMNLEALGLTSKQKSDLSKLAYIDFYHGGQGQPNFEDQGPVLLKFNHFHGPLSVHGSDILRQPQEELEPLVEAVEEHGYTTLANRLNSVNSWLRNPNNNIGFKVDENSVHFEQTVTTERLNILREQTGENHNVPHQIWHAHKVKDYIDHIGDTNVIELDDMDPLISRFFVNERVPIFLKWYETELKKIFNQSENSDTIVETLNSLNDKLNMALNGDFIITSGLTKNFLNGKIEIDRDGFVYKLYQALRWDASYLPTDEQNLFEANSKSFPLCILTKTQLAMLKYRTSLFTLDSSVPLPILKQVCLFAQNKNSELKSSLIEKCIALAMGDTISRVYGINSRNALNSSNIEFVYDNNNVILENQGQVIQCQNFSESDHLDPNMITLNPLQSWAHNQQPPFSWQDIEEFDFQESILPFFYIFYRNKYLFHNKGSHAYNPYDLTCIFNFEIQNQMDVDPENQNIAQDIDLDGDNEVNDDL